MLPDPDRWNHAVQQVLGRDEFGPAELETRVELAGRHFEAFVRTGVADSDAGLPADARIVELGTGWHPAVPILMHLLGAAEVQSVDHVDHTSDEKIHATVQGLAERIVDGSLRTALPARTVRVSPFSPPNRTTASPAAMPSTSCAVEW